MQTAIRHQEEEEEASPVPFIWKEQKQLI